MTSQNTPIRIDTEPSVIYPAFIDYDFVKNRPRGGSCRIDFFSYGRLSGILDDIEMKPFVFIRKNNVFFENGMFLVDFAVIESDPSSFVDMVNDFGMTKIYLEESDNFPLQSVRQALSDIEIVPMCFY